MSDSCLVECSAQTPVVLLTNFPAEVSRALCVVRRASQLALDTFCALSYLDSLPACSALALVRPLPALIPP
jgi:hypothetical protein